MKNKLVDLNNHLFEQLERLNDDELTDADLEKENYSCIITNHFGSNSDEIVTTRYDKRTGATTEVVEPLSKYATHPTGYRHQLDLQGYKVL